MRTNMPEQCQHIAIAHGKAGHISICPECNVVQVVLSHLSVRFAPDAFRDVAHMFGAAQSRLDHIDKASAAASALIDTAKHGGGPGLH
jgi:hypothetical protein